MTPASRLLAGAALLVLLGGCRGCPSSRPPIHIVPNMDDQPRMEALEESRFFADGKAMRHPPAHTVPQGALIGDTAFSRGVDDAGSPLLEIPVEVDDALLVRGENRYGIFCSPCHGDRGDGKGMLFQRAQVQSANLLEERIRSQPDGQIFKVVTEGFGLMPRYDYLLSPRDRWAVVAWIRTLQERAGPPVAETAGGASSASETAAASASPGEPPEEGRAEEGAGEAGS